MASKQDAPIFTDGQNGTKTTGKMLSGDTILLHPSDPDMFYDLVCIGFGPASLAIAIALHDATEAIPISSWRPRVCFLERQLQFGWHAGMLLPAAKMQISFIKDLVTLRNPRSKFTFLNYLHQHDRLVQFTNLGTFLPSRLEFSDYLRWCSSHFKEVVKYGQEVLGVCPQKSSSQIDKFDVLAVRCRNVNTQEVTTLRARHVVIAVGGRPSMPDVFKPDHGRIIHSSKYATSISKLLPVKERAYCIAVVGGGQSAAEVFRDLQVRFPNASARLILRDTALRPSDDSPFVNEIFDPSRVTSFYGTDKASRERNIQADKGTNYSVVRLELLEQIYQSLYEQRVQQPDERLWQHRILTSTEVVEVVDVPQNKRLNLVLKKLNSVVKSKEILSVDAVVVATGYLRDAHDDMLSECKILNGAGSGQWEVMRDYRVKLDPDFASSDIGIWLQGCNEGTHGLSDSLLSILATRSGELVHSIFSNLATSSPSSARHVVAPFMEFASVP